MIRTLAALAAILTFSACEYEDGSADELGAQDVCEQFVEDQLKSPGSAEFSETTATNVQGERWAVDGVVDSQNSFGAMVRNRYRCVVVKTGEDETETNWQLRQLSGMVN